MKILFCHNFYQRPGGEDQVYHDECWLLEHYGHQVLRYEKSNDSLDDLGRLAMATKTLWNHQTYREIRDIVQSESPDIVHFHNTFPLISPSAYYAASRGGAAIVQTLHNYRTICPGATLLRDRESCHHCVGRTFALAGIVHKCYRNSRSATGVIATLNTWQRIARTQQRLWNRAIALTEFSRQHFVESGLDPDKIVVKPNFVRPDPGFSNAKRIGAVFVGRLSKEKGIETLLDAWKNAAKDVPLKIIGDGPLKPLVTEAAANNPAIQWLGQIPFDKVLSEIGSARLLVFPSCWAETFGRSMIEAFATGTPVVASDMASMKELITHGKTGLHFRTGDAVDLATKILECVGNSHWYVDAGKAARREFVERYSAEANVQQTMSIYEQAIKDKETAAGEKV
ncbi:MAG: glycosyltransferase family 4 protein [Planctomycetota bacterium]